MSMQTITYNQRPALFVRYMDDNNRLSSKRVFAIDCGRCEIPIHPHPENIGYADWNEDYVLCVGCTEKMVARVKAREKQQFYTISDLSKTISEIEEQTSLVLRAPLPKLLSA